ncbi:MAG: glycosyltransferase [Chlorobi bacterium]|nr:glycosyltransferase [Chlorobiota bacterium]
MKRIVCFGPGPKFKGGIANYNTSLAKAFDRIDETEVHIVSWTQQYPSIIPRDFIDRKSKADQLAGTDIVVHYVLNYNNPISWEKTADLLIKLAPDLIVFQWAIAIQGLPYGWVVRRIKKAIRAEILFDLHFVIQKEGSVIDNLLTSIGISNADTYIVHAEKTIRELSTLFPERKFEKDKGSKRNIEPGCRVIKLFHPVYDMFVPDETFDKVKYKQQLGLNTHVFLFFGFIREYKGLHNVIRAFAKALEKRTDISLLIVGESFWQTLDSDLWTTKLKNYIFGLAKKLLLRKRDDSDYRPLDLIAKLDIDDHVVVVNEFIPNEDVHIYFQVSDYLVLYYLTATPSGVESIAYNFNLPILATKVGHFEETIKEGINGYLAEPDDIDSMSQTMLLALDKPINRENISKLAANLSWDIYAQSIIDR